MAQMTLADAVVRFVGDDSQLKKDTAQAKGGLTKFAGTATKLLGGAAVAGAVALGAAVLKVGTAAFDVSRQTEQASANIAASLGIPTAEAEKFAEVARRVYGNNFAESVTGAADVVAELNRQLGITSEIELQSLTEQAFAISDVFGTDVNESVSTVKTLMENFGLSSQEAFDFLTAGYQRGLDRSGDFTDSINEYATQFASAGADAGQFFSLMESGLQGGMLGTDKAADAFKEFRVRIIDGSSATSDALDMIGLSAEEITQQIDDGTITIADAWDLVTGKLGEVEDQSVLMQAGVGLIGTQFEDLGEAAVLALNTTQTNMDDLAGSTESLNRKYENFGDMWGAMWRKTVVAASPLTDKLLDLANRAMPVVEQGFNAIAAFIESRLVPALDGTTGSFDGIKRWIDTYMPGIRDTVQNILSQIMIFWENHGATIMHVVQNTFHMISTIIGTMLQVITGVIQAFLQIMNGDFQGAFQTLQSVVQSLWSGIYEVFRTQLDSIRAIISDFGGSMYDGGRALIENLWRGIRERFDGMLESMRDRLQRLRDMLPGSEPKDTGSPLYGLRKSGQGLMDQMQRGIDDVQLNISSAVGGLGFGPQATGVGASGNIAITINVGNGGPETGKVVRDGVLNALRQVGLR
jgi:phage-related minor tail protein